jgi:hypothetical protein
MPWIDAWEQAIDRDLLSPKTSARGYHAKFFVQGLLRGDAKSRSAFYESAITRGGWMTRNEARRLEDMDPLPGLDEILEPVTQAQSPPTGGPKPAPDDPPTSRANACPPPRGCFSGAMELEEKLSKPFSAKVTDESRRARRLRGGLQRPAPDQLLRAVAGVEGPDPPGRVHQVARRAREGRDACRAMLYMHDRGSVVGDVAGVPRGGGGLEVKGQVAKSARTRGFGDAEHLRS